MQIFGILSGKTFNLPTVFIFQLLGARGDSLNFLCSSQDEKNCPFLKERVHSEMKISLIIKGILMTVPIRFISFRLFYLFLMTERLW